jgi:hypothetical protein
MSAEISNVPVRYTTVDVPNALSASAVGTPADAARGADVLLLAVH